MANYSYVVDAVYDPLSFEEIERVPLRAATYHQALQDKYDELKMTTAMYDSLIPKDDPEYATARAYLDEYLSSLNNGADVLMKNGAWGQNEVFSGVKDTFSRRMMPVQFAWNKRDSEYKEQAEKLAKNPLLEFSRDAAATGLDAYIKNPMATYKTVDPVVVTGMVSTAAAAFAKELRDHPEGELALEIKKTDPEGYIALTSGQGLRPEQVMNWMKYPHLYSIMKRALNSVGMDIDENGTGIDNDTWSAAAVNRVLDKAYTGFASGVGGETLQIKEDAEWAALQQQRLAAMRAAASNSGSYVDDGLGLPNSHNIIVNDSITNGSEVEKLINAAAALGYDNQDGKIVNEKLTLGHGFSDGLPGAFRDLLPGRSAGPIMDEICKEHGWFRTPGLGKRGSNWVFKDKAHKIPVSDDEIVAALNDKINSVTGSFHTLQDVSLASGYNSAFQSQKVYPVETINADGTYKTDEDNATTIASIIGDKDVTSIQVGASSTVNNNGIMLVVTKGTDVKNYFIKTDRLSDAAIKAAVDNLNKVSSDRDTMMKQRGLTSDEWNNQVTAAAYSGQESEISNMERRYNNAVLNLQNAIGGGNTISATNLNGK